MATSTTSNRDVHQVLGSPPKSPHLPLPPGATGHFLRHLGEMLLAMMVGMMALGVLDRGILSAAGTSVSSVKGSAPEVVALVMAFNMTVGMTVWMRHRRHSWAMCAEMGGAMFIPAIAAIVLLWCGAIHSGSVLGVEHAPMLPAMVGVMLLRRSEYSQPMHHRSNVQAR